MQEGILEKCQLHDVRRVSAAVYQSLSTHLAQEPLKVSPVHGGQGSVQQACDGRSE